ncbi:MAG: single-stranded DNA-binding protein [Acidobacteria bacterium]|nr:single-stranded DNA-binding protein [Acidobacteriota bacterium]
MSDQIPGSAPRACECTYRGNLAAKPQLIEKDGRKFVSARMGVNMAAPNVPREEQDELTEWVDMLAFPEVMQTRLLACNKGETIAVFGHVTKKPYERRDGGTAVSRTIIPDSIRTASGEPASTGDQIRGSIPRACDCTYRGRLAAKPELVEKDGRKFVSAQVAVHMVAPNVPREKHDELTEWVDVIVFSEAMQARLLTCEKGETISVAGNVTKKPYERRDGETAVSRTIIADYVRAASASIAGTGARKPAEKVEQAPQPDQPPE